MERPLLRSIPMPVSFPPVGELIVTFTRGQWDEFLEVCYREHVILLEMDQTGQVVGIYQKSQEIPDTKTLELPEKSH